jgi:hypothetical protein
MLEKYGKTVPDHPPRLPYRTVGSMRPLLTLTIRSHRDCDALGRVAAFCSFQL